MQWPGPLNEFTKHCKLATVCGMLTGASKLLAGTTVWHWHWRMYGGTNCTCTHFLASDDPSLGLGTGSPACTWTFSVLVVLF